MQSNNDSFRLHWLKRRVARVLRPLSAMEHVLFSVCKVHDIVPGNTLVRPVCTVSAVRVYTVESGMKDGVEAAVTTKQSISR